MKKIFAIALALVMVLSMASAFATYCDGWNWNCSTTTVNCNKASIEVVPYIRATNACSTGFDFTAGTCAAAVPNENVYFGLKVTVPSDMSKDWWENAKLSIKLSNVQGAGTTAAINITAFGLKGKTDGMSYENVKKGGVYYLFSNQTNDAKPFNPTSAADVWANYGFEKEDADFTFGNKNVFSAKAMSTSAKVCATLASNVGMANDQVVVIGEYAFRVRNLGTADQKLDVMKGWDGTDYKKAFSFRFNSDLKLKSATYWDKQDTGYVEGVTLVGYNADATAFKDAEGNAYGYACNEGAFLKEIFDFMHISFDTCMTKDAIKKNIGWDDEVKSCTNYSKTGSVAVNPECQVEIPKTGDVSVVAYAVMALVAAAGAMGLKK